MTRQRPVGAAGRERARPAARPWLGPSLARARHVLHTQVLSGEVPGTGHDDTAKGGSGAPRPPRADRPAPRIR